MERIEFYKNRTLSERFSASIDFLKQNWKVLYKNILIGAIPLALLGGFFMQYYLRASLANIYLNFGGAVSQLFYIGLYFVFMIILMIYLNAMPGAVLKKYDEGKLTPSTGWNDLHKTMLSLSGKTFVIGLILWVIIVITVFIIAAIIGMLFSGITSGRSFAFAGIIFVLVMFIMLGLMFAFAPFLALAPFPAYFSGAGNRESIKIAFGMGFRNWGSMIVTLILAGIALYVIIIIFSIPNIIVAAMFHGEVNLLTFVFSFLTIFGEILTYPIMFIFIAFQYFSIVEKEQSVSLQSKVSEFENL